MYSLHPGYRCLSDIYSVLDARSLEFRLTTSLAGVVDEHDLHEQVSGRAVDDAVNCPQQGAPRLVVKHYDDAGVWQVIWIHLGLTADEATGKKNRKKIK